jgi:hypothetical protein
LVKWVPSYLVTPLPERQTKDFRFYLLLYRQSYF